MLPEWCASHWPDPESPAGQGQTRRRIGGRRDVSSPGSLSGTSDKSPAVPGGGVGAG